MQDNKKFKFIPYTFRPYKLVREIDGHKYQFMGEYTYNPDFIYDIKRTSFKHGLIIKVKYFKPENKVELWSRKK